MSILQEIEARLERQIAEEAEDEFSDFRHRVRGLFFEVDHFGLPSEQSKALDAVMEPMRAKITENVRSRYVANAASTLIEVSRK